MSFDTITPVLPHIKSGKLRALAVTTRSGPRRFPTCRRSTSPGSRASTRGTWFGVLAPAGTPKEVVARLSSEMVKVIHSADFKKRMEEIGAEPVGNTPEQMARQIKDDTDRYARLVKDAKVSIE
jgi:tripartite-type tricarboxylate transporter receptor subunit TctC